MFLSHTIRFSFLSWLQHKTVHSVEAPGTGYPSQKQVDKNEPFVTSNGFVSW